MMASRGSLVLIEPRAEKLGGHWYRVMRDLAAAASACGIPTTVVLLGGPDPRALNALHRSGAEVLCGPRRRWSGAAVALIAAQGLALASRVSRRVVRHRRFPHQLTLLERCLRETAGLRIAAGLGSYPSTVVILTASEALHGAAAMLSGTAHLRFVHHVTTREDWPLRVFDRLLGKRIGDVVAFCPTPSVQDELAALYPRLRTLRQSFAPCNASSAVVEEERRTARCALAIDDEHLVVCLVGGWWPHKDIETVERALYQLTVPIHLIVAGCPVDERLLDRISAVALVTVHALIRDLDLDELRAVYAASDAAIVSRHVGATMESGLILDAACLGVPLVVSRHDPRMTALLEADPSTVAFDCGAAAELADILDRLSCRRPPRPDAGLASRLGARSASEMIDLLVSTRP